MVPHQTLTRDHCSDSWLWWIHVDFLQWIDWYCFLTNIFQLISFSSCFATINRVKKTQDMVNEYKCMVLKNYYLGSEMFYLFILSLQQQTKLRGFWVHKKTEICSLKIANSLQCRHLISVSWCYELAIICLTSHGWFAVKVDGGNR